MSLSLRAKGGLAVAAILAYAVAMFAYVQGERDRLLADVAALEGLHVSQEAHMRAALALSDALFIVHRGSGIEDLAPGIEKVEGSLQPLGERYRAPLEALRARYAELRSNASLLGGFELRAALVAAASEVDRENRAIDMRRAQLNAAIRAGYARITEVSLTLGVAGLALLAGVSHAFFGRLAAHLNILRGRAAAIVQGYRGPPLAGHRRDELGELSRAIDGMAAELAERERRLELGLRRQIHVERMAAVGAMAAHAAHEIGNPLAAICGYAEELRAQPILDQAQRIAAATRRMAELAQLPGEERAVPVDLAAAVRAVCELLRFDPRLRAAGVAADIAPGLPAAQAMPGALSHALLNLVLAAVARLPAAALAGPVRVSAGREGARLYARVAPAIKGEARDAAPLAFADAGRMLVAEHLAADLGAQLELDPAAPSATLWLRSATDAETG